MPSSPKATRRLVQGVRARPRQPAPSPRRQRRRRRTSRSSTASSSPRVSDLYLPPLRPYQLPVLLSTARDDVTISAPQLGKTLTGGLWLLAMAWAGGASAEPWWWTAPTYGMAKQGFEKFCDCARSAGILRDATTSVPLTANLINGARIEARSWEIPEHLYGPTIRGAVIDEFGRLDAASLLGAHLEASRDRDPRRRAVPVPGKRWRHRRGGGKALAASGARCSGVRVPALDLARSR